MTTRRRVHSSAGSGGWPGRRRACSPISRLPPCTKPRAAPCTGPTGTTCSAGVPAIVAATFHPYWDNARWVQVEWTRGRRAGLLLPQGPADPAGGEQSQADRSKGAGSSRCRGRLDYPLRPGPVRTTAATRRLRARTTCPAREPRRTSAASTSTGGSGRTADPSLSLDEPAAAAVKSVEPQYSGGVLTAPVRGRDFRVIAIE